MSLQRSNVVERTFKATGVSRRKFSEGSCEYLCFGGLFFIFMQRFISKELLE